MPDFEAMRKQFMALKGINERLHGLTDRHDLYPAIDPQQAFSTKSYAGKVVLITGASRGIGPVMATFYAQAGAKVALIARSASNLDVVKKQIQEKEPGAEVLTFEIDVKDTQAAAKAVQDTVDRFGRIDVVVANAGTASPFDGKALGDREVTTWWNTMEVNMLGTMNFVGPSLNHLKKTHGYVIVVSSYSAHIRQPTNSDYCISKHALNRLVEFIALEYSGSVKSYAIHPGAVYTDIPKSAGLPKEFFVDTPELSAATVLALSSGRYDWLSGRFVDCTIDLGDVEQRKEQILSKDALVAKLVTL